MSKLDMYGHLSLFPKHYSVATIYVAFLSYEVS
jgi:hypothetical protein